MKVSTLRKLTRKMLLSGLKWLCWQHGYSCGNGWRIRASETGFALFNFGLLPGHKLPKELAREMKHGVKAGLAIRKKTAECSANGGAV